jgi:hypothetical protein
MGDRPGSFPRRAQVRTKVCRKDYGWSVGLVYDPRGLPEVTTARPGVAGVLQISRHRLEKVLHHPPFSP